MSMFGKRLMLQAARIVATTLTAAALWGGVAGAQNAPKVKVVTSFSILADVVRQVGGARVDVTALVGPDQDMHGFEPTPADVKTVAAAQVFVLNGLGLEGWADRLAKSSGFKGQTVVASHGIEALPRDHGHGEASAHVHGRHDPHCWQDVANVKRYVQNIRDALAAVDPAGTAHYAAESARYLAELDALAHDIKSAFAAIPRERRKVITSHDAFAYFGAAYDVAFIAAQGVGKDAEPSAKRVAELIRQIKTEGVALVFLENISNPRLIDRIARESGARIGGTLFSDALSGPNGPAPTYIAMMRHNTRLIVDGLTAR